MSRTRNREVLGRECGALFHYSDEQIAEIASTLPTSLSSSRRRRIIEELECSASLALRVRDGFFHSHISGPAHRELSSVLRALDSMMPILDRPALSGDEARSVLETLVIQEGVTPQAALGTVRRFRDRLARELETKPRAGRTAATSARELFARHVVSHFRIATRREPTLSNRDDYTSPFEKFADAVVRPTGLLKSGASVRSFVRIAVRPPP